VLEALRDGQEPAATEFLMLRDGQVVFEGSAGGLRASGDAYIREFLS
jgi:ABC-type transporter Mla maintaining outer membrane lipid asymmetry ATPase subunit MlaF